MKNFLIVATFAAVLAAGCGTTTTAPRVDATTHVSESKFDNVITTQGPTTSWEKTYGFGVPDRMSSQVVAMTNKSTGKRNVGIVFTIDYSAKTWRFYRSASLDNAQQLPAPKLSSDVHCWRGDCNFQERVTVWIPESFLEAKRGSGFELRMNADAGPSVVVTVSAAHIASVSAVR
jgi:hypothetical protein